MLAPTKIVAWFNAFIPKSIPGLTQTVQAGVHSGSTVIPGPPLPTGTMLYHTDQRTFDSNENASSRLHSRMELTISGQSLSLAQTHRCGPTIEIDGSDGAVTCQQTSDTSQMQFSLDETTITNGKARVHLKSQAGNPCASGAPSILFIGLIEVEFDAAQVVFNGSVQSFPAHEGYLQIDGGSIENLYQLPPTEPANPWTLFQPPTRGVNQTVAFP